MPSVATDRITVAMRPDTGATVSAAAGHQSLKTVTHSEPVIANCHCQAQTRRDSPRNGEDCADSRGPSESHCTRAR